MSNLLNALAVIVGLIIAYLIIWGIMELICKTFNVEDSLVKAIIHLVVFVGFFIIGRLLQKKALLT